MLLKILFLLSSLMVTVCTRKSGGEVGTKCGQSGDKVWMKWEWSGNEVGIKWWRSWKEVGMKCSVVSERLK